MSLDNRIADAFPEPFDLLSHTVCAAYMGSTSHNTYVPQDDPLSIDDVDIMGIVVPPPRYSYGLGVWEHWTLQKDELDVVFYSMRKFVGLLLKANPNVVGLIWLKPELYIEQSPAFTILIENRHIFSSKLAYKSFTGYAYTELRNMEHLAFKGYMGEKRKAIVMKHGYDTKSAAHLVRHLRMGIEFLQTGELNVFRISDADEIRAIKRGEWTLEQVRSEADRLFTSAQTAYDTTRLPDEPDRVVAERLLMDITREVWARNSEH